MINLFNVPSKMVKNETSSYIWKVSNGYKISRKTRVLLGLKDDEAAEVGIGTTGDNKIFITTDVSNCTISKNNLITKAGIVDALAGFGEKFEVLKDVKTQDNVKYYELKVINEENNEQVQEKVPFVEQEALEEITDFEDSDESSL
jgi:hypothetical protein